MTVPGMNLLAAALTVIQGQAVTWLRATGRTQNAAGQWIATYDTPIELSGSFQAIDSKKYEQLGLDLDKKYYTFYASAPIVPVGRGESGDRLYWNGRMLQVHGDANWYSQDGWTGITCVDVGEAPP